MLNWFVGYVCSKKYGIPMDPMPALGSWWNRNSSDNYLISTRNKQADDSCRDPPKQSAGLSKLRFHVHSETPLLASAWPLSSPPAKEAILVRDRSGMITR
ncbi:Nuclear receptor coactivator 4 [Anopheles sinensis]|uniref:Nuclear receptor coactivator 4 n=1 Tax=Anopheles sinensis TaxID=74873 RepID=A0A084VPB2_ANOSI|nr:Nuclear receptor coactivator 4 [Anopheles sinensis]